MSIRSTIALLESDGSNQSIYCHSDGYPEYVGKVLLEDYNTRAAVESLMAVGDISSLGPLLYPLLGKAHSYDNPIEGVTVAYGRDRNESGCQAAKRSSLKDLLNSFADDDSGADYLYVYFSYDQGWTPPAWYYAEYNHPKSLHLLS